MTGPPNGPQDLADTAARWLATRSQLASGPAVVFYLPQGAGAPVRVTTRAFASTAEAHSIDLLFYDPDQTPSRLLMVLELSGDYLGPGEYRGGASDILAGLGVVDEDGEVATWTAAPATESDLSTYGSGATTAAGTFSSSGLTTGPLLGPPAGDTPACSVLFAWFELETPG